MNPIEPFSEDGATDALEIGVVRSDNRSRGTSLTTESDVADEQALVAGLRAGDKKAFRQAVESYSQRMLATARSIVGPSNAEDIVQDAWLTVFQHIDGFEQRSTLRTWLLRIVSNRAITHLRARARDYRALEWGDQVPEREWFDQSGRWAASSRVWDADSPDGLLAAAALEDCIERSLLSMPVNQRLAVVMRDMQGLGLEAICGDLGVSAGNVRVLLHRGRMKLMKSIDCLQETG